MLLGFAGNFGVLETALARCTLLCPDRLHTGPAGWGGVGQAWDQVGRASLGPRAVSARELSSGESSRRGQGNIRAPVGTAPGQGTARAALGCLKVRHGGPQKEGCHCS